MEALFYLFALCAVLGIFTAVIETLLFWFQNKGPPK